MAVSYRSLAKERGRTVAGTFDNGPTVGKVIRDADTMRQHARYVIELDHHGDVVDHYLNDSKAHHVDCIVVLAPAKFMSKQVDQAVALEIGFSRFVPYKMTEFKASKPGKKKQVKIIQERTRVGTLPWNVMERLLPVLWHAIQVCVDKRMETWTRARFVQEYDGKRGLKVYEAWITIRIPKDQPHLFAVLRLKDEKDRCSPGKNYAFSAEIIHREISSFRKLKASYHGNYPDEIIKGSGSLRMIADWMKKNIKYRGYTDRSFDAIRKLLAKHASESRRIFDEVCRIFKVPKAPCDKHLDEFEPLINDHKELLVRSCTLRPVRVARREQKRSEKTDKQGAKHALNCYTISILGSKEHMLRLEERNSYNRLSIEMPEKISPITFIPRNSEEDADIPWDPPHGELKTGTNDIIPF